MGSFSSKPQAEDPPRDDDDEVLRSPAWGDPVPDETLTLTDTNFPDVPLVAGVFLAASAGFFGGASRGGHLASRIFLAENTHRAPTTYQGWYFYNKTKNYHVAQKAIQAGAKRGLIYASIASAFLLTDVAMGTIRTWAQARAALASRPVRSDVPFPGYTPTGHDAPSRRRYPMHAEQADSDPASATSNGGTAGMDVDAHMDVDVARPSYDPDRDIALLSSTQPRLAPPKPPPWWSQASARERAQSPWRTLDGLVAGGLTTLVLGYSSRLGPTSLRRTTKLGMVVGTVYGAAAVLSTHRDEWLPKVLPASEAGVLQ